MDHVPHFELPLGRSTDAILRSLGEVFPLIPYATSRERLTYLDTFDWRLWEMGLTLTSARVGKGVRLTLYHVDGEVWELRASGNPAFASELEEGPLRQRLEPVSNIRRLLPRARADWQGETRSVLNQEGKTVVRLLLRQGRGRLPDRRGSLDLPHRLQLLPLKGYGRELLQVQRELRRSLGVPVTERTELAMVLEALGVEPGSYSSRFDLVLSPTSPAREAVRTIHRFLLETMLVNEDGLIQDLDSEFLHDFRVAVRRTRSALTQLKGIFPPEEVEYFGEEFRWLGARTGPTRDMDVYLLKIPSYQAQLPDGVKGELEPLVRFLEKKKAAAHGGLVRTLRSKRYKKLLEDWDAFLEGLPRAEDEEARPGGVCLDANRTILAVASERIWKAYKRVLKKGKAIRPKTPAEALHRLRIDCKKLRYLIHFFQSLYPQDALKPILKELKRLQDNLGDFNDLHVQRDALLGFAEEMMETGVGPPATLMAMGQLMGQLEAQQLRERKAFRKRFRRFSSAENQARFKELFGSAASQETGAGGKGDGG